MSVIPMSAVTEMSASAAADHECAALGQHAIGPSSTSKWAVLDAELRLGPV
jgi:hypothetical protein